MANATPAQPKQVVEEMVERPAITEATDVATNEAATDIVVIADTTAIAEDQRLSATMAGFTVDNEREIAEQEEAIAEILKLEPSLAFTAIEKLVDEIFIKRLEAYAAELPEEIRTAPNFKFTPEIIQRIRKERPFGITKSTSASFDIWFQVYTQMNDLVGEMQRIYVDESELAGETMTVVSRIEYQNAQTIYSATNNLFRAWNRDAATLMTTEERTAQGFKNELATIKKEDETGNLTEVLWNKAFPGEIAKVVAAYRMLVGELVDGLMLATETPELIPLFQAKIAYYTAVANAYEQSTLESFREADWRLPGQVAGRNDTVIHIHGMEAGYWIDGIQRIPETSFRYPDSEATQANKYAEGTKVDMLRELKSLFDEGEYQESTRGTLEQVQLSTFMAAVFSGAGMENPFLPAGQILPNEVASRIKGGISITGNISQEATRADVRHRTFAQVFSPELAMRYYNPADLDFQWSMGSETASHEFGHAIGIAHDTLDRINPTLLGTYVEEWKATTGGMVLAEKRTYERHQRGESTEGGNEMTMEKLKHSIAGHCVSACRYAKFRKEEAAVPYLRKSIMLTNLMLKHGIIAKTANGWDLCLDDEKVLSFYAELEEQYKELLAIYDSGTTETLQGFLTKYLQPTEFTRSMFDGVDSEDTERAKDLPTPEHICALAA